MALPCFHLSIPAHDLAVTRAWYERVLGCVAGRCSPVALILELGGHQLVAQHHPAAAEEPDQPGIYPRHFGLVFEQRASWEALRQRVEAAAEPFAVAPRCRFAGEVLEHHTFFLRDPSGNWLEFKHYTHPQAVLGCREQTVVGDAAFR